MTSLRRIITTVCCGLICAGLCGCHKSQSQAPAKKLSPAEKKQQRLEWNLKTTVAAYESGGRRSSSWDGYAEDALNEFAHVRAKATEGEPWQQVIATNCAAAVDAGCDDPMILYLFVKFSMAHTNDAAGFSRAYCRVAQAMEKSSYPPVRKFYAEARALQQLSYTYGLAGMQRPEVGDLPSDISDQLLRVLQERDAPPDEVYEVCAEGLQGFNSHPEDYEQAYRQIEASLFSYWPNEATTWMLKGEAFTRMAWNARGSGFANTVTPEGWKAFSENLSQARQALEKAWKLDPQDPRIAVHMLSVELGEGKDRKSMEQWFQRAMDLDPNDYDACSEKLNYLEPKWYGSVEEAVAFGRQCAQNKKWGGDVPLILLDAHYYNSQMGETDSDKAAYWKRPEVWPDLRMAFDRFFEANPEAVERYNQYALYAFKCEQWTTFLELVAKLEPGNYNYFGNKDGFDAMVRLAKEHAVTAPAGTP
ncbi:MAG TPA: hypothetical protein VN625_05935 [Desulfuromonadaceae bacterium]|nr:hypothetical protein [Desulfuromonadaceae bacterium]